MNPAQSLFGTSGIRGDAEKLFTPQFCFDLGRTFAKFLDNHKKLGVVGIGMDPRGSSPRIKASIVEGLTYEGREVADEGATSVPSMCYLTNISDNFAGSIMVSGSHIKDYLNGVKFFAFKDEILKVHEKEIEEIYQGLKGQVTPKQPHEEPESEDRAKEEYKEMLLSLSHDLPSWKVVVDAGDGAQSDTMPQVLRTLGINVIEENCTIQGEFFARDTENPDEFTSLTSKVLENKADFGVAYDSDGDRAVFVDSKGNFIPGEYTAALVATDFPGDTIVTTIGSSQVVDHLGKKVIRTKVGSPYVVEAMKQNHCKLGFEANGGVISGEIMHTRDGGSTTIKVLNYLKKKNTTLDAAIALLPKFFLSKTKVDYKWELKDKILKEAKEEFQGEKVEEIDGLKIWLDSTTWILFRSSMNAPEFRVFAESDDEVKSKELLEKGINFVKKWI
jgi:phosphomannomutase